MASSETIKTLFILNLFNLEITEDLADGYELAPALNLTNNRQFIRSLISHGLRKTIGQLETDALEGSKALLYLLIDVKKSEFEEGHVAILNNILFKIRVIIQAMWFVKDNSINFELGFLEAPHLRSNADITSNFLSNVHTNCLGQNATVAFSIEEIEDLTRIIERNTSVLFFDRNKSIKGDEASRLLRVMYFLDAARGTNNIGVKTAFYCTCFEALFSTGIAELAHKLAERIALFVGATPKERHEIYNDIKSAYAIRSKVIHGDKLSSKADDKPKNIVTRCDSLLRTMLNKILESPELRTKFNGSSGDLDKYFLELSFGEVC